MSATRGSWDFDEVCTAVRTAFPSHGAFAVGESDAQDGQATVVDPEVGTSTEAMIAGLQPIEESDAVEVLAWRQTRTAKRREKLTRGLRPARVVKPGGKNDSRERIE